MKPQVESASQRRLSNCFLSAACSILFCTVVLCERADARELFYVLDSIGSFPDYSAVVKVFDLNGAYQYEFFLMNPPEAEEYTALATDGSTVWLARLDMRLYHNGHIRSFAIRPGGLDGVQIPLQTHVLPTHGGCTGLGLVGDALFLSRTLTWGTPTGRVEAYSISQRQYTSQFRTDVLGWYPGSLQAVGNTLLIESGGGVYGVDTTWVWEPYGPTILKDAPLGGRAFCANGDTFYSFTGGGVAAFDWAGNRKPAQDATFSRLSRPLDIYLAWGPDEPVARVSPLNLDFGTVLVGQTADLTARIENTGSANLLLTDLELTNADNFWQGISLDSLPATYTPGGFVSFTVRFQPQSTGDFNEELIIRTNDAHNPEIKIALAARAVSAVWYVDSEVEGGDGTSWESAFADIPEALSDSRVVDGAEIRIRGGEYHDTIQVSKSVSLIGGFDEQGNRSSDGFYPYIDGHGSVIPLKVTASNVTIEGFDIERGYNHAVYPCRGGGIDIVGDNVTIADCWIGKNRAQYGGGIGISGSSNTIRDCWIEGNEALYNGGGVLIVGGSDNRLVRTKVLGNWCTKTNSSGGGLYNQSGPVTLVDCELRGNRTNGYGGGIYSGHQASLVNCLVCDNENAVVNPASADARGAGVFVYSDLTATNCTVAGNKSHKESYYGAGIYCHGTATVTNSIVWGNRDTTGNIQSHQVYSYNLPVVTYSDIEDAAISGTGVIHGNPMFMDANAPDIWDRDYRLHEGSPCIDSGAATGAPDHDLDGTPRPYDDGFDMGALEWIWRYPGPWYVDAGADEGGDGRSWAKAFRTIGEALEEADDDHEIWVKAGTYHLGEDALWIGYDVLLLGGFAGAETDKSQRDPAENPTVIDGDSDGGCMDVMADALIDGFTITNGDAGGGGGIDFFNGSSAVISNCSFVANHADIGGAMLIEDGSAPLITDCRFICNIGHEVGGGIDTDEGAEPIIINCLFAGNHAGFAASALSAYHGFIQAYNCTFAENSIGSGDYGGGAVAGQEAGLLLDGCILWDNTGPENVQINIGEADLTMRYCSIDQDGFEGVNGNVRRNPLFASSGRWDDNGTPGVPQDDTFIPGDYHLQSAAGRWDPGAGAWVSDAGTSLCIDAGNPGLGVGQESLPHGNRGNLGAYGRTVQASRSPDGWSIAGDLNNDGTTDVADLAAGLDDWLETDCDACPMDLDGDGDVDLADYAILAETWLDETVWF